MQPSNHKGKNPIKSFDISTDFSKVRKPNAEKWSFLHTKPFNKPSAQQRHLL